MSVSTLPSSRAAQPPAAESSDFADTDASGSDEQSPTYGRSVYNHSPTVAEYMSMLLSESESVEPEMQGALAASPRPLTRAMRAMSDSQAPGRRIYHGDVPIESLSDDEAVPLAQSALQFLTHANRSMTPRKHAATDATTTSSHDSSADKSYTTVSTTSITSSDVSVSEATTVPVDSNLTINVTQADESNGQTQTDTVRTSTVTTSSPQLPPFHASVAAVQAHTSPLQSSPVFGSLPGFADVALNTPSPIVPMVTPSLASLAATPHFLSRELKSHDNLQTVMSLHGRASPSIFNRTPGFSPRLTALASPTLSLTSPTLMSNLVKTPLDLKHGTKHSPSIGPTLSAYLGPIGKTYADGTMTAGVHSTSPNVNSGKLGSIVHTSPTMISSAFLKSPVITQRNGSSPGEFKLVSIKSETDDTMDSPHSFSIMNRLKYMHSQQYKQNEQGNGKRMKLEPHITAEQSAEYESKLRNLSVVNAMMPINTPVLGSNMSHINKHLQSMSASPDLSALPSTDAGLLSALKHKAAMIDVEVEQQNTELHGLRCHQCKLKRSVDSIAFCCNSNNTGKKLMTATARICRNKYCDLCLLKYYTEVAPDMSRRKIDGYINISNTWSCPACRNLCCCNGCKRLRRRVDPSAPAADVTKLSPAMLVAYSMVYYPNELNTMEQQASNNKPAVPHSTPANGVKQLNSAKPASQQTTPKLAAANGTVKTEATSGNKATTSTAQYPFNYTASATTSSASSASSSYPYSYGTTSATAGSTSSTNATYPYSYINGLRTSSASSTSSATASYPYNYYGQTGASTAANANSGTAAALQQTVPSAIVTAYPGYSYEPKTQNYLFTANNLITYLYSTVKKEWVVYSATEAALCSATNSTTTSSSATSKVPPSASAAPVPNKPATPSTA